ncbi:hypothetical protein HK102_009057, partial [Quaeritorhiza haematococci]
MPHRTVDNKLPSRASTPPKPKSTTPNESKPRSTSKAVPRPSSSSSLNGTRLTSSPPDSANPTTNTTTTQKKRPPTFAETFPPASSTHKPTTSKRGSPHSQHPSRSSTRPSTPTTRSTTTNPTNTKPDHACTRTHTLSVRLGSPATPGLGPNTTLKLAAAGRLKADLAGRSTPTSPPVPVHKQHNVNLIHNAPTTNYDYVRVERWRGSPERKNMNGVGGRKGNEGVRLAWKEGFVGDGGVDDDGTLGSVGVEDGGNVRDGGVVGDIFSGGVYAESSFLNGDASFVASTSDALGDAHLNAHLEAERKSTELECKIQKMHAFQRGLKERLKVRAAKKQEVYEKVLKAVV